MLHALAHLEGHAGKVGRSQALRDQAREGMSLYGQMATST